MKQEVELIEDHRLKVPEDAVCVPQLVERRSQENPDAAAIITSAGTVTYGVLNRRANGMARQLSQQGVAVESLVGIYMERSAAAVIAALGVFKAGGAYLPLDPSLPQERLAFMLADANVTAVVTNAALAPRLPKGPWAVVNSEAATGEAEPLARPAVISANTLAYVIYTSGSTGKPKGVEITHGNLVNLVRWHNRAFEIRSADRASLQAAVGFDAAVWELWPYLASGASVAIPEEAVRNHPESLRDWLVEKSISITFLPTAVAESMLTLAWPKKCSLRILLTGAETLHKRPPANLPFAFINNYGPTENTVVATSGAVETEPADGLPSIGRPIDRTEIFILDEGMRRAAQGAAGELYIGGAGVARGYRNNAALTAERFIRNPFSEGRLYRTGDLGRLLPNGEIEFLGRVDEQIKIRGFRVEPGEIVGALNAFPGIQASAVAMVGGTNGDRRLAAYVVVRPNAQVAVSNLREALARCLPEYMVPSLFGKIPFLPLTLNGKVDSARLPALTAANALPETEFVAPQTLVEQKLAAILIPLLRVERVSAKDNFFLLGGHSLLGTQLITRIKEVFGVELSLLGLFDHPTLEDMSVEVENLILAKMESHTADGKALPSDHSRDTARTPAQGSR